MKKCKVENCENKHHGNGYCRRHYSQIRKFGKIFKRTRFDKNEIISCGDYCEVVLYSSHTIQKEAGRALIDKEDLDKIKNYKWGIQHGYAGAHIDKKTVKLHRFVLGYRKGYEIDHKNHNILDNRKQNLRFVTHHQNSMNKAGKGYSWNESMKKWTVQIKVDYKTIHLGCFNDEQDAIKAIQVARQKYRGEFAYKNKE
jgi:hypothetical protein